jgi:hypothetical protein
MPLRSRDDPTGVPSQKLAKLIEEAGADGIRYPSAMAPGGTPRWTPENRPVVDGSKPASGERPKHESSILSPLKDQGGLIAIRMVPWRRVTDAAA